MSSITAEVIKYRYVYFVMQGKSSAENYLGKLSIAECEDLLTRYAPRSVDRQTLPPLKLAF